MIKVTASAKFPHMKPAHHTFIQKQGEGSSFFIACRNALLELEKDERLKGKRTINTSPVTVTFAVFTPCEED